MAKKTTQPTMDASQNSLEKKQANPQQPQESGGGWPALWQRLQQKNLRSTLQWIAIGSVTLLLVAVVIWVMGAFYIKGERVSFEEFTPAAEATATLPVEIPAYGGAFESLLGIGREASLDTFIPDRPRFQVIQYTVEQGDTVFGIAERFSLSPSTIFWGNFNVLFDDPHSLSPGQVLNILPENGTYYEWNAGDGLNGVAEFYGVDVNTIINWPGNNLVAEELGDLSNPNLSPGTWLFIPGGSRELISWTGARITREEPTAAKVFGEGYCGTVTDGFVGTGNFIWPTVQHFRSGYDWSPETNHFGLDLGGALGQPLYAMDNGVIVYAGWNDRGYGYMVVIDHVNWQTLYAHMNAIYVACGASVAQGDIIGEMGTTGKSTGPHLHLEMWYKSTRVNPWDYLPPP